MTSFSFFKYFDAFELDVNVVNFVYYGKTRLLAACKEILTENHLSDLKHLQTPLVKDEKMDLPFNFNFDTNLKGALEQRNMKRQTSDMKVIA